ncbi:MAG: transposase [Magnetococcales bacterium]|nr:transposase [Magnetococcales bacterium]
MNPTSSLHRRYEALKAFYHEGLSADAAAAKFGFAPSFFKKMRYEFGKDLREGVYPFFLEKKPGPKERLTSDETVERIVSLRKQNYSINDIKVVLDAEGRTISLETIDKILKADGFAPLPKRTRQQRLAITLPKKFQAPKSVTLDLVNQEFTTETGVGPIIFMPLIEKLGIVEAIKTSDFPETSEISNVQSILSFLALKLMGNYRWSHDTSWNMDRGLGLFAGLNVLPKSTTLSTYSYRVTRQTNLKLLTKLAHIFKDDENEDGEFNLDFKAIPHWGEVSVLEKNWSGARSKAIKSLLSLIVQDPSTGYLSYTDAEVKHRDQNDAVLDFVDFWKNGRGIAPKMLIFDSKLTTYENLNKLNQSKEKIKFLTLRRRSKNILERAEKIPAEEWEKINIERTKGKYQLVRVHDGKTTLRHYEGDVREIILTDHGRQKPAFLITNDFDLDVKQIIRKYARRWLVEQEIAEQISFFHLNNPSSSIVVKVDFDLTLSLLAHNLFRVLANAIPGFEHCTADTISRKFLENGARIEINDNVVTVHLKKKTHIPLLFSLPWIKETTQISWLGIKINFMTGTVS